MLLWLSEILQREGSTWTQYHPDKLRAILFYIFVMFFIFLNFLSIFYIFKLFFSRGSTWTQYHPDKLLAILFYIFDISYVFLCFVFIFFIYFIYYIIENLWAFSSSWTQYQPDKTESCLEIQIQITVKRASLSFPDKLLGILFWNIIFYISHFFLAKLDSSFFAGLSESTDIIRSIFPGNKRHSIIL